MSCPSASYSNSRHEPHSELRTSEVAGDPFLSRDGEKKSTGDFDAIFAIDGIGS